MSVSPAHLNFPRETNKCVGARNSFLMSKPYVPFNQAALWLENLGSWPINAARVQSPYRKPSMAKFQGPAGEVSLLLFWSLT